MLSSFKKALSKLTVYSADELREKYEEEEKNSKAEHTQKKGDRESVLIKLGELVQKLDESQEKSTESENDFFDIAKIDAKIAELEKEEKERRNVFNQLGEKLRNFPRPNIDLGDLLSIDGEKKNKHSHQKRRKETPMPAAWITELMPKQNFSVEYSRKYIVTLLDALILTEEDNRSIFLAEKWSRESAISFPNTSLTRITRWMCRVIHTLCAAKTETAKVYAQRTKYAILEEIRQFTEDRKFTPDDLELMRFFREMLFLLLSISEYSMHHSWESNWDEAHTYIYYYIAKNYYYIGKHFWFEKPPMSAEGLLYAKKALVISDYRDRQDAFDVLGGCAIETLGCKQLAYDSYYSWIHKKAVGEIVFLVPPDYVFEEDNTWREKEGKEETALMHNQFSYVCGMIADTYERYSKRWCTFNNIALEQIEEAIKLSKDNSAYYCTHGTLLSDSNTPDQSFRDALAEYRKYKETAKSKTDRLTAARCLIDTTIDEMQSSLYRWSKENDGQIQDWASLENNTEIFNELMNMLTQYQQMISEAKDDPGVDADEKENKWQEFLELLAKLYISDIGFMIKLLMVDKLSQTIMGLLKRREYSNTNYYVREDKEDRGESLRRSGVKPIAYYTTLKTVTHLFDVLFRENKNVAPFVVEKNKESQYKDGINCLTMMHAHYMNDPTEGMALADCVSGNNPHSNILFHRGDAAQFRTDIFKQYYVFLKSFTDKMDDLLMWNRYASDRTIGSKDSNGCCVRFHADFFDRVNDSEKNVRKQLTLLDDQDDYALYRVVYISRDGSIDKGKNPELSAHVCECYYLLIKLLREINKDLCDKGYVNDSTEEAQAQWIRNYVQSALRKVIFLFKHDEYSDEEEYRLVVTRSHNHLENIRLIPNEPDMLCVNPYFQVCIDKVVLGPNVSKTDPWTTYFRYQMTRMWQRALRLTENEQIPELVIEKSKIHYHT